MFRYTWRSFSRELILLSAAAVWWIPLYVLFVVSLRAPGDDLGQGPLPAPQSLNWENYAIAWERGGSAGMGPALVTSAIVTVGSVLILLAVGSMGAYVLARRDSRLSRALYLVFAFGIFMPVEIGIVTLYAILSALGLVGTYVGVILVFAAISMPISVFLYTGFIRGLPRDYEESARIDGAGHIRTFSRVVAPLLKPTTASVAIITGVFVWNDFFLPLILLGGHRRDTLPVAVYSFVGELGAEWHLLFAAVVITVLPVLIFYLLAQRTMIRAFAGGLKG